jgi:hypothetical protein
MIRIEELDRIAEMMGVAREIIVRMDTHPNDFLRLKAACARAEAEEMPELGNAPRPTYASMIEGIRVVVDSHVPLGEVWCYNNHGQRVKIIHVAHKE